VEGRNPGTPALLVQARAELGALEERVAALRMLLDRAAEVDAKPDEADSTREEQARSMASHLALEGYPRWSAEDRLRGMVGRRALREVLDQVYGPKSRAS
jgi:hypothetical protein